MHLLFYSPQTLPSIGGLQYVVHYWAEALTNMGHSVTVVTETPDNFQPSGELAAAKYSYQVLRNISFFQQVKAMRAADKVLMFNVSLKGLPVVLMSGKPLYVSHHTALWYYKGPRPFRQKLKQWVANRLAVKNCACSQYIAALYNNCHVIHSPFREDVFVPGDIKRQPGSVVFAGRLVSDKGVDLLIEAVSILVRQGMDICLTIIGDGPDFGKLVQLAQGLGLFIETTIPLEKVATKETVSHTHAGSLPAGKLEGAPPSPSLDRAEDVAGNTPNSPNPNNQSNHQTVNLQAIQFTGSLTQPELVRQLQTHEVMVVPSRMEPMGMVVAEGLACGCRMVVSNQGGMPEVGGNFCRYFESGNVESLAEALQLQLTNPLPIEAASLQKHLEKFTIEYSAGELEKWLEG